MTTNHQELTSRYVSAGSDSPHPDARRLARALFVRDTIRALYDADKRFGIHPADNGSLAELVDAAEEHLEHIANDVSPTATSQPPTGGANA